MKPETTCAFAMALAGIGAYLVLSGLVGLAALAKS